MSQVAPHDDLHGGTPKARFDLELAPANLPDIGRGFETFGGYNLSKPSCSVPWVWCEAAAWEAGVQIEVLHVHDRDRAPGTEGLRRL